MLTDSPAPHRKSSSADDPARGIEAVLHHAIGANVAIKDILIQEGQAIRAKSARGSLPLHQLIPGLAPFVTTREHIARYLAAHPDSTARALGRDPLDPAAREQRIDLAVARQRALHFRLDGPGGTSLRCCLFARNGGELVLVMRVSPGTITPLSYLTLPQELLNAFTESSSGLILITGPTGSAKSETAMAVLDWHNAQHSGHILTLEDPVEKKLASRRAMVSQREVGVGVPSFADGMREALRMCPDIVYASEIGDPETAARAIQCGESGSLMLATTHGRSTTGVLRKILGLLGTSADAMRPVLAGNLVAVVRQSLVPARNGERYFLVADVLYNAGRVTQYLERGDWAGLEGAMRQDHYLDATEWFPMNLRLAELVDCGDVEAAEAMRATSDIPSLRRRLSGFARYPRLDERL